MRKREKGEERDRDRETSCHVTRGPPQPYCSCAVWGGARAPYAHALLAVYHRGLRRRLPSQSLALSSPRRRQPCGGSGTQESLCTLRNMSGRARVRARGIAPRHGAREVASPPGNLMVSVSPCGHLSSAFSCLLLFPDFSLLPRVSTFFPPKWLVIVVETWKGKKALWIGDAELLSTFLAIIRLGNP